MWQISACRNSATPLCAAIANAFIYTASTIISINASVSAPAPALSTLSSYSSLCSTASSRAVFLLCFSIEKGARDIKLRYSITLLRTVYVFASNTFDHHHRGQILYPYVRERKSSECDGSGRSGRVVVIIVGWERRPRCAGRKREGALIRMPFWLS